MLSALSHSPALSLAAQIQSYTLPPAQLAKAYALYKTRIVLDLAEVLYGFVVLACILAWKLGPRYRDIAERLTRVRVVQAFAMAALLMLTLDLAALPFHVYGHHVSLSYRLSVERWIPWLWDWTKAELLSIVVVALLALLFFSVVRRSPRRWWLYMWLLSVPLIVFATFVIPVVVEPMFNTFEPLSEHHPEMVRALADVAHRAGLDIPSSRMFLMKASEKYTTANAYVTGIGSTKRVVVWDTTLDQLTVPETQYVFGHELGHYVLQHIPRGIAFASAMLFIGFYIFYRAMLWLFARYGTRWRVRDLHDWAALPAILLVASVISFFSDPIANGFSRYQEHQADVYGLNIIEGLIPNAQQVAAHSFQVLGERSLDYPYPNRFIVFWSYDHPPSGDRLRDALEQGSRTAPR
jgi:STE24 endopeptidase